MENYDVFWEGFEKEAGLKHLLTAGMIAASPAAKAGGGDALKHLGRAVQSQWGHVLKKKAPKAVQQVQQAAKKGVSVGSKGSGGAKVDLEDLSRLRLKSGPLTASVGGGGDIKAKYNIGKGLDIKARGGSGEKYVGVGYRRDF